MFLLAIAIFGSAAGVTAYALLATLTPNIAKIRFALAGQSRLAAALAAEMPRLEKRSAVRRRSGPQPRSTAPLRAAA